ncbi:flavin-containing monooxygenase [Nocardia thraciensis]
MAWLAWSGIAADSRGLAQGCHPNTEPLSWLTDQEVLNVISNYKHGLSISVGWPGHSNTSQWDQSSPARRLRVAVIGAGVSGLCLAVQLSRMTEVDFTVYERASDIGGTWRDNTYPGLTCDVPATLYSYKFAQDSSWTRLFPSGSEIHRYLHKVSATYQLESHLRLDAEVTKAQWDGAQWQLSTTDGCATADVLVTATGFLRHPVEPNLPGLDTFEGTIVHSARWNVAAVRSARRVAVIGTGASGTQIVSAMAGSIDTLFVCQRTPQWIMPIANPPTTRIRRALAHRWPKSGQVSRLCCRIVFELLTGAAALRPGPARLLISCACRAHLRLAVHDPDLRDRLRPPDRIMCKRILVSSSYYQALQRDGVVLVDLPIAEIAPDGFRTANGTFHSVDTIVLATGFDGRAFVRPLEVIGSGGKDLATTWTNDFRSYRSVAVPGFPNFFTLIGPYSPIGNQSQVMTAETQTHYVIKWIRLLTRTKDRIAVMPTDRATDLFMVETYAALRRTAWASGCRSWYTEGAQTPLLWPWNPRRFRRALHRPVLADFEYTTVERMTETCRSTNK